MAGTVLFVDREHRARQFPGCNGPPLSDASRRLRCRRKTRTKALACNIEVRVRDGRKDKSEPLPKLGFTLLDGASPSTLAFMLGFSGGAILTMLATSMMPEAYEHAGRLVGIANVLGFVIAGILLLALVAFDEFTWFALLALTFSGGTARTFYRRAKFWIERFIKYHVEFSQPVSRFDDERVIAFKDPDGLMLELVAHASAEARPKWTGPSVPADHSIRGIYSVTLWQESCDLTGKLLTETLGFRAVREQASIFRYAAAPDDLASIVDLRCVPGLWEGVMGAGTIHHVAFRAPDDESQSTAREELVALGYNVTPQIDRDYFHSVYFREPGGVLFEIATDPPGFTVDEPLASLGQSLKLPEWLEPRRFEIEALLPNIRLPMRIPGPNA